MDAIPVHMINGAWGLLAVGLFASPSRLETVLGHSNHVGFFYSFGHNGADGLLLAAQIVGMLFILGWVMCIMLPFFVWLDWRGWFRSDPLEEIVGLDTSYHGGLMLGGEDQINPEYVSAFNKRREENVRRRSERNPNISNTLLSEFDHEEENFSGEMDKSGGSTNGVSTKFQTEDAPRSFDAAALEAAVEKSEKLSRSFDSSACEAALEKPVPEQPEAVVGNGVSIDL